MTSTLICFAEKNVSSFKKLLQKLLLTKITKNTVAQLDVPSDWRPGGRGFNPRQDSFVEIDHEIFSMVILPSADGSRSPKSNQLFFTTI